MENENITEMESRVPQTTGRDASSRRTVPYVPAVIALLLLVWVASPAAAQEDDPPFSAGYRIVDVRMKDKTVTAGVWYPAEEDEKACAYGSEESANRGRVAEQAPVSDERKRYPFLCYSHGFGGSGLGSTFMAEPLARQGWIVVAPDHHDPVNVTRIRGGRQPGTGWKFIQAVRNVVSGEFDFEKYAYRGRELRAVLDHVLKEEPFGDRIDRSKMAVGGHSFGGYTALRVCGALGDGYDPAFQAFLLHSPGIWMYEKKQFRRIDAPVLYMLGQNEASTNRLDRTKKEWSTFALESMRGPGYYVELKDGNHFSFNTGQRDNWLSRRLSGTDEEHAAIRRFSTAFLDYHVLGEEDRLDDLSADDAARSAFTVYPRPGAERTEN